MPGLILYVAKEARNTLETIEDLQYKGYKIYQRSDGFKFGVDAVLAAYYAQAEMKPGQAVLDLGTGTGIIPILLAARTLDTHITGLEIQADMAEMARRSVALNHLESRVSILTGDIANCPVELVPKGMFHHVVSNPPYQKKGSGIQNPTDSKAIARHEIFCTLEDVISLAARSLTEGGTFTMVHRPDRLCDIMNLMRQYRMEPKALRMVHPTPGKAPSMVLVRGTKGGNPYLKVEAPLYIFDNTGSETEELQQIYNRD